jgi:hypothetical protein
MEEFTCHIPRSDAATTAVIAPDTIAVFVAASAMVTQNAAAQGAADVNEYHERCAIDSNPYVRSPHTRLHRRRGADRRPPGTGGLRPPGDGGHAPRPGSDPGYRSRGEARLGAGANVRRATRRKRHQRRQASRWLSPLSRGHLAAEQGRSQECQHQEGCCCGCGLPSAPDHSSTTWPLLPYPRWRIAERLGSARSSSPQVGCGVRETQL